MIPVVGNFARGGKYITKGYQSFRAFKRANGSAGVGKSWHHIVEQNPKNIKRYGPEMIHNENNLVKIPSGKGSIHAKISGHYSSKPSFLNGMTVREWLSTQSFEAQRAYGLQILKQFGY